MPTLDIEHMCDSKCDSSHMYYVVPPRSTTKTGHRGRVTDQFDLVSIEDAKVEPRQNCDTGKCWLSKIVTTTETFESAH
jgi:hypothetical protein